MVSNRKGWLRLLAMAAALLLLTAACGSDDDGDGGGGTATGGGQSEDCANVSIGFFGALTGDNANLGVNIMQGAQLAVDQYNEENPDCEVGFERFDSQGSPDQAPALAQQAVQNEDLVGLVGPAFSGESRVANPIFEEANLPIVTPSATGVDLSENGWDVFHRAVGNDNSQGPAAANYMTSELNVKTAAVIDDASEYGKGIADIVRTDLRSGGATVAVSESIDPKAQDYSSTVTKIRGANVDAIFYGGYYAEAGRFVKQLRDAGVTATLVAPDGVLDPGYIEAAGATSADGTIITCPCAPLDEIEGGAEFQEAYREAFDVEPGTYSPEAYDAANVLLEAISEGNTTREAINEYLNDELDFQGITKQLKFNEKGEIAEVTVYAYKVEDGEIVPVGPVKG